MAVQTINIGQIANDGTGDDLRVAFAKVNSNFTDIGDYIFDSKKINYFGIIPIFNKIKLASDHKPVISINNLQINLN